MNQYVRMIVVLFIFSVLSGAVLAFSYEVTIPKIQEQAQKDLEASIKNVIPGITRYEQVEKEGMTFYIGLDDQGNKKGIAFKSTGQGFGGPIEMMVGYDPKEGKLTGLQILSMAETPGLGARIQEPAFTDQFKGKSVNDPFVPKEDVQVITGATISPAGVANGIKTALEKVTKIYPVGGDY
ncbi:RnfABCDGE type electron transport complex subunit G [Thermosediminibacter oceani]|uniref:Ion-translocating oxidoreductase complex subunit G n=1 Tax=Thermosediminibacter oceani (strain ATCC BAA-1034 / DSM 16646 / JW/IW-1228P) TaxID=555079 RepID=D9S242_THEOJ|nr:RnfABCDGE type electron transport complex subunit G [Thermosediminibacter oceani]ADL07469.1 electron transport complex, RnfABCDGE type, G subunit [Thermosediminibacter oceani DSM 16646]